MNRTSTLTIAVLIAVVTFVAQAHAQTSPAGQPRLDPPPADLLITNEPMTNVVTRVIPPRPNVEDKTVESPRGAELSKSLPPTEEEMRAAAAKRATEEKVPDITITPQAERDLDNELVRANAAWVNLSTRMAATKIIYRETGVKAADIEAQFKADKNLRGGDLLMGNKIAAVSGKSFSEVYSSYNAKKQWLSTGESFGVSAGTLMLTAQHFKLE